MENKNLPDLEKTTTGFNEYAVRINNSDLMIRITGNEFSRFWREDGDNAKFWTFNYIDGSYLEEITIRVDLIESMQLITER